MSFEQCEHKLIEENPALLEEAIKECFHKLRWYDRCEKPKDPFTSKYARLQVVCFHDSVEFWKICLHKNLYNRTVQEKSTEIFPVDIFKIIVFNERHEEPECESFWTVQQQLGNDKVHALDITNFTSVVAEGDQDVA